MAIHGPPRQGRHGRGSIPIADGQSRVECPSGDERVSSPRDRATHSTVLGGCPWGREASFLSGVFRVQQVCQITTPQRAGERSICAAVSRAASCDLEVHCRQPTPGPTRVRSADRRKIQSSSSRTPSRDSRRGRSASSDRRSRSREGPLQCFRCKGYGHFTNDCLSEGFYR